MASSRKTNQDTDLKDPGDGTENPPHPFALIAAMRSIGYTVPTALADLVDNSITANSTKIRIRLAPPRSPDDSGHMIIEDNGKGMSSDRLQEAMRWGGNGPDQQRAAGDLGRFGLGMKTASLSMGRTMSVATRSKPNDSMVVLRWDLDHVSKVGWRTLVGADETAAQLISESALSDPMNCGTVVVVTNLDRLSVRSGVSAHIRINEASLLRKISEHLGLVFHRFIEGGLELKLGSGKIPAWDPFEGADFKDEETLGGEAKVASYVLPHHSRITEEQNDRAAGPLGWTAHQGFLIYRARRLLVPGGWLRLFSPEESCRLARIRVDLPNTLDDGWHLNVMKSSVVPPSWIMADLQRIGDATRREARALFNFRGERQAPSVSIEGDSSSQSFWNQIPTKEAVRFRINRSHPLVQALKQELGQPKAAESFLRTFERLLPLDAILQDPKRTTNGATEEPTKEEIQEMIKLTKKMVQTFRNRGHDHNSAVEIILSAEPFALHRNTLEPHLTDQ